MRIIGVDTDKRVCEACACPFCVRDTNGSYTHGERLGSQTQWHTHELRYVNGVVADVWEGVAVSQNKQGANMQGEDDGFALATTIAFSPDHKTPLFVNISHPLWIQTAATITDFTPTAPNSNFDIPASCPQ
jgi:hypothetical protein